MKVICIDRGVVIILVTIPAIAYTLLEHGTSQIAKNAMAFAKTSFHLVVLFVLTFILFQLTMVPRLARIPDFAIHNCRVTHERRPSKTGIFVSRVFVIFQLGSLYFILYWLSVAFLGLRFFTPYMGGDEVATSGDNIAVPGGALDSP